MTASGPTHLALDLRVDRDAPTPVYLQLRARLVEAVASGRLRAGTALPSERSLAEELRVSRMTVRRAVTSLVDDLVLERRHGSGTYVRAPAVEQTCDVVLGFTDEARLLGFRAGTTLLEVQEAPAANGAASALGLVPGTPVLVVTRLRTANDVPLAIQRAHLAPAYAGLSLDLLRRRESLYATLQEQFGVAPHGARQTVTARTASATERRLLEIGPDVPILALERTSLTADGEVVEYVRSAYRGDRYRLAVDLGSPGVQASQPIASTPEGDARNPRAPFTARRTS